MNSIGSPPADVRHPSYVHSFEDANFALKVTFAFPPPPIIMFVFF